MKFTTSTLVTFAIAITLGNAAALPPADDALVLRAADGALPLELQGVEEWTRGGDDDDDDDDDALQEREVRPKYHFKNFPKSGGKCAARAYSGGNVKDAGAEAGKLADRNKQLGSGKYPHGYGNREEIKFSDKCKGKTLEESYTGTPPDPGADRVVVTVSNRDKKGNVDVTYCGMMTHEGAPVRNGFVVCS
ncbi:hypothetical protein PG994_005875 [Apiospora phragmitis]|uniref:Uncharacterized protein n=1 Tax=Apiospora phragmitis TaxID=2905665 RepID=A0ABR1VGY9_9PEZI